MSVIEPQLRTYGSSILEQGCQMVCFQTKNPNLSKFCGVLLRKILVYFMANWKYFVAIWYILWYFGIISPVLVFWTKKNLATLFLNM
jgi:hypothetical protein